MCQIIMLTIYFMSEIWDVRLQRLYYVHGNVLIDLVLTNFSFSFKICLMSKLSSRAVFSENRLGIDEGQGVRFRG